MSIWTAQTAIKGILDYRRERPKMLNGITNRGSLIISPTTRLSFMPCPRTRANLFAELARTKITQSYPAVIRQTLIDKRAVSVVTWRTFALSLTTYLAVLRPVGGGIWELSALTRLAFYFIKVTIWIINKFHGWLLHWSREVTLVFHFLNAWLGNRRHQNHKAHHASKYFLPTSHPHPHLSDRKHCWAASYARGNYC